MRDFLVAIGICTVGACLFMVGYSIYQSITEWVSTLKYKYRCKHRFDNPPTARCFCRDCRRHDDETNICYKFEGYYTADNWFCWDAELRDAKYEKKE